MTSVTEVRDGLRVWTRFAPFVRQHRGELSLGVLAALGAVALEIVRPWTVQWVFDHAIDPPTPAADRGLDAVWEAGIALLVITVLRALLQYAAEIRTTSVGHAVTRALRHHIFAHLSRLSPDFHARHKSGDLLVRLMGDVPMLRTMLVESTANLVTRGVLIVGTAAMMVYIDPFLAGLVLVFVPLLAIVVRVLSKRLTIAVRKQRNKEGALADFLHEAVAAAPVIQSLGGADHTVRRFARSNRRSARAGMKSARLAARMSASVESLMGLSLALVLALGAWRVLQPGDALSAGQLLVFLSYVRSLLKPIRSLSKHSEKIARGAACGERVLAVLEAPVEVRSKADARAAPATPRALEFARVHHRYRDGTQALRGFDARFERGVVTGLVGASGAGKSTVAALALRMFDPTSGAVRIDGQDLRDLDLDSLRGTVALVWQEPVLFGETVRENLLVAQPDAGEDELVRACQTAGAGFVLDLPEGLDTVLGTAGAGLSGGERRRLSLARTLLRDAQILIVDEPFAGLDRRTALDVRRVLHGLAGERVVVVISHDVEHIDAFDRVVFLEDGHARATGTHAELVAGDEAYQRVVAAREVDGR